MLELGEWREKTPSRAAFGPCEAAAASAGGARPEARPTGERARGPERASRGRCPGPLRRRPGRPSWRRRRFPHPHPAQRRSPPLPPLPPPAEAEGPGGGLPQVTVARPGGGGAGVRTERLEPGRDVRPRGLGAEVLAWPDPGVLSPRDSEAGTRGARGEWPGLTWSAERSGLAWSRVAEGERARPGIRVLRGLGLAWESRRAWAPVLV